MKKITVVLLPGLNGTDGLFKSMIDIVPEEFNVVCISYPTHEHKTYSELTDYVLKQLSLIKGNYVLLGESFSGPISIFISRLKPKGLLGTILVATFVTAPQWRWLRYLPWTLGFVLARPLYALRILLSRSKNSGFLKAASFELQKVSPKVLVGRIHDIFLLNAKKELADCNLPMIYFRGDYDFVVPAQKMKEILAIKPEIQIINFKTQHFLLQTAPKEAWLAILEFTKSIK